jgi:prepilin-type N-terminal cleavage/methylation domain-containing protein
MRHFCPSCSPSDRRHRWFESSSYCRSTSSANKSRRGISLLEVVLALAILAVASAYLAQSMNIAAINALRAENQTQAENIAESVMNQVVAGVLSTQSVSWVAYSNPNPFGSAAVLNSDSQWMYTISSFSSEVQGMIAVQISVNEIINGQADDGKADYTVTRWIIDPSLGLDTPPAEDSSTTSSSTTGTSSTGGTNTGGTQ